MSSSRRITAQLQLACPFVHMQHDMCGGGGAGIWRKFLGERRLQGRSFCSSSVLQGIAGVRARVLCTTRTNEAAACPAKSKLTYLVCLPRLRGALSSKSVCKFCLGHLPSARFVWIVRKPLSRPI